APKHQLMFTHSLERVRRDNRPSGSPCPSPQTQCSKQRRPGDQTDGERQDPSAHTENRMRITIPTRDVASAARQLTIDKEEDQYTRECASEERQHLEMPKATGSATQWSTLKVSEQVQKYQLKRYKRQRQKKANARARNRRQDRHRDQSAN